MNVSEFITSSSPSTDTIVAVATGAGSSAIAIIRCSGPQVPTISRTFLLNPPVAPRCAQLTKVRCPADGSIIDLAVALWFSAPASSTGEDVLEFHIHGSRSVVRRLMSDLCTYPGVRVAKAGEFTYRALLNGKIDLLDVEVLSDLMVADTERQRQFAIRDAENREGGLRAIINNWRARMLEAMASIDSSLEFHDDVSLDPDSFRTILDDLEGIAGEIEHILKTSGDSRIVFDGVSIALVGEPNSGKSSLFNRLANRDAAIVSPIAGTTRDILECVVEVGGVPARFLDTGGYQPPGDPLTRASQERAKAVLRSSDYVWWVSDLKVSSPETTIFELAEKCGVGSEIRRRVELDRPVWRLVNKIDLVPERAEPDGKESDTFFISALSGAGVDQLLNELAEGIESKCSAETGLVRHQRQIGCLTRIRDELLLLLDEAGQNPDLGVEIAVEYIRQAVRHLSDLTGRIAPDEVLEVIFKNFCIGK